MLGAESSILTQDFAGMNIHDEYATQEQFDKKRWKCPVCHRSVAILSDSTLRSHGSVGNRCAGKASAPAHATGAQVICAFSGDDFAKLFKGDQPRILKYIPKAARPSVVTALTEYLDKVHSDPADKFAWAKLLIVFTTCLKALPRGGSAHQGNLTSMVKKQTAAFI